MWITADNNAAQTDDPNIAMVDTTLIRAYFAGQALTLPEWANPHIGTPQSREELAKGAFRIADEMMKWLFLPSKALDQNDIKEISPAR